MANLLFNRWVGLIFISMGISLVIIDGTIVNTIFPTVIKELHLNSTDVQWVQVRVGKPWVRLGDTVLRGSAIIIERSR